MNNRGKVLAAGTTLALALAFALGYSNVNTAWGASVLSVIMAVLSSIGVYPWAAPSVAGWVHRILSVAAFATFLFFAALLVGNLLAWLLTKKTAARRGPPVFGWRRKTPSD